MMAFVGACDLLFMRFLPACADNLRFMVLLPLEGGSAFGMLFFLLLFGDSACRTGFLLSGVAVIYRSDQGSFRF